MHARHQELVVFRVLHNALAALDGFLLVHIVIGIDFGMVLLQCVTVHQVADDEQVRNLECGMAGRVSDGVNREHSVGEAVAEGEQVQAIPVEFHDHLLQVVFRDVFHPCVVFHLARIDARVLESLRVDTGVVFFDKARDMVHVEVREVDDVDVVGIDTEGREAAQHLSAEGAEACIEQDVLAVHLQEECAHRGGNAFGHVEAFDKGIADVAEKANRVQLFALVVLDPRDARPVGELDGFRPCDFLCIGRCRGFCRGRFYNAFARLFLGGGYLGIVAAEHREGRHHGEEGEKMFFHKASCLEGI